MDGQKTIDGMKKAIAFSYGVTHVQILQSERVNAKQELLKLNSHKPWLALSFEKW